MNWNAEADAKLFLGVLNQLRDAKLKLDYEKLAEFMGPDCLPGAVNNRIVRLRRKAEGDTAGENSNSSGNRNANAAESGTGTGAGSAETSPQKRKVERKPRGKGDAKAKAVVTADEAGSPKKRRVRQVKDIDGDGGEGGEGVGLVKREVKDEVMGQEDEDEEMA